MTALQWSSMLKINYKRALVAVVQRHVPYEQKDMGFQRCRKATHSRTTDPAVRFPLQTSYLLVRLLYHLPNLQNVTYTTV